MWSGEIVSIFTAPAVGEKTQAVNQVRAVPGHGLEGDRYFLAGGFHSEKYKPDREITLIELEAIEALLREEKIHLEPGETRRNLITRGAPLNHLVGKEFMVGEVRLRGLRLCEPCQYLASKTEPGVLPGLIHRGGLRAQILTEGMIRVGDIVRE